MRLFRWPRSRNETAERVTAYVDGELSATDRARFEAELRESRDLNEAVERERALKQVLRASLPEVPAPRSFALTAEMAAAVRPVPARSWIPAGAARVAQATAAIAILGFATLTMIDLTGGTSENGRDSSQAGPASMEAMSEDAKADSPAPPGESPQGGALSGDSASGEGNDFRSAADDGSAATPFAAPQQDDGMGALRLAQIAAVAAAVLSLGVFFLARRERAPALPRK